MKREEVQFDELIGAQGLLSGVWTTKEQIQKMYYDDETSSTNVMYFMWNGVIYMAAEDEQDGYRSSLRFIERCPRLFPANVWDPSERCTVRYREQEEFGEDTWRSRESCSILEFVSDKTGKVVMSIGTANVGDYYPACVLRFDPLAMSHNQPEVDLLGRGN